MWARGEQGGGRGRFTDTARAQGRDAAGLLARGAAYMMRGLDDAGPETLGRPTPCAGWDLRVLLGHLDDSVAALTEALAGGVVGPPRAREAREAPRVCGARPADDLVASVRAGIARLVEPRVGGVVVTVGDRVLAHAGVAVAGAMELAVHGWDVGRATGARRPVPAGLALRLLRHAPRLVPAGTRGTLFARPVPVPEATDPGDLLVAYLGRDPRA
ncbi:TIGR03086 family metal-binding protein [Actinomadura harenae]|uniref:TIGR03086 family protein n=1 Tax=Actinomadura harenae TaxID=2483351 RepID=A0A3M2LAT9_9ACTN|nr:TIGR03086 family metal-binding protein [Actinomadura harenae]RMI33820.1 TIGR03086 family protein [Actinomadura harenae]